MPEVRSVHNGFRDRRERSATPHACWTIPAEAAPVGHSSGQSCRTSEFATTWGGRRVSSASTAHWDPGEESSRASLCEPPVSAARRLQAWRGRHAAQGPVRAPQGLPSEHASRAGPPHGQEDAVVLDEIRIEFEARRGPQDERSVEQLSEGYDEHEHPECVLARSMAGRAAMQDRVAVYDGVGDRQLAELPAGEDLRLDHSQRWASDDVADPVGRTDPRPSSTASRRKPTRAFSRTGVWSETTPSITGNRVVTAGPHKPFSMQDKASSTLERRPSRHALDSSPSPIHAQLGLLGPTSASRARAVVWAVVRRALQRVSDEAR